MYSSPCGCGEYPQRYRANWKTALNERCARTHPRQLTRAVLQHETVWPNIPPIGRSLGCVARGLLARPPSAPARSWPNDFRPWRVARAMVRVSNDRTYVREDWRRTMTLIGADVAVWTGESGCPERLVWNGRRYRVSDTPTRLEADTSFVTHLPPVEPAWRFQGITESGECLVFDVGFDTSLQRWCLLSTYR
jgi:hypothetical protein